MLNNHALAESVALRTHGHVTIPLPEDDAASFLIVMSMIHGKEAIVPEQVSLRMLSRLATVVDKFDFHEAVQVQMEKWISYLYRSMPTFLNHDLTSWIWISYVFRMSEAFKTLTAIAQRQSKGPIDAPELISYEVPLPTSIVDAVSSRRLRAISRIQSTLELEWQRSRPLMNTSPVVAPQVDLDIDKAFRFGMVCHLSAALGIPIGEDAAEDAATFEGVSFQDLSMQIRSLKVDQWRASYGDPSPVVYTSPLQMFTSQLMTLTSKKPPAQQGIGEALRMVVEELEAEEWGLRLEDARM
ncbi:hypothetical protein C8034_v008679 [Colletotrichum sidae]|uniref:Uncharacterized protein n=1 Tax=Colletotrichum sidae TaxID=1347389 RepID=A0A4R8TR38_9PEZI|nr:hypothetical protein C8034_v008679 [Colletotrichum sidae]